MNEPSLLDYLKQKLNPRHLLSDASQAGNEHPDIPGSTPPATPAPKHSWSELPWRSALTLLAALIGQRFFEPGSNQPSLGIGFYLVAGGLLILALLKGEWSVPIQQPGVDQHLVSTFKPRPLGIFIPLFLISFFAFSGNRFSGLNLLLWLVTFLSALAAFWVPEQENKKRIPFSRINEFFHGRKISFSFNGWHLLVLVVFLISAWFHLSQLSSVPLEMTSDHTEKLLDIQAVLNGNTSIFFPGNGGREPIQFYLAAGLIKFFGFEMGFTVLKMSMALAFLASLYYVYRLGNEVGSRWTGLLFMLLMGISSWVNILARSGMRLVLTPVFVAPVLFYLFRGLRLSRRNDLLLAGFFLGLGMLGYSAFRVMPLVVLLVFVIYWLHHQNKKQLESLSGGLGIVILFALIGALPLIRYISQYPQAFAYRMATRMTGVEQAISGSPLLVFLQNSVKALGMPFWRDGNTWILSVVNRPALDVVSAAFFLLGVILLLAVCIRKHNWVYLSLLVIIPVLMLPSIMALAFPTENPSPSRAGGAVIPILLIAALTMESGFSSLWQKTKSGIGKGFVILAGGGLMIASMMQNYDLVFRQYDQQYKNAAWNTSEMGRIARGFIDSVGSPDTVWVVAVPYWVDTRLVAINAGYVGYDYQIWADNLGFTVSEPRAKLFFVKADDTTGMETLTTLYPTGFSQYHPSTVPGRDFFTYLVPPAETGQFSPGS
ncbi:MAG: glycosyltransferase family 39 protein [Anaerolineaceae bacterium]